MTEPVQLPALPSPLRWHAPAESWRVAAEDTLEVSAGGGTDLFTDPDGSGRFANAPALLTRISGDFQLSARVRVEPGATFDAAVLLLHIDADRWAKLCLERSPQGRATVVSVVTRGVSDDANSVAVASGEARLRISRRGPAYAFHADTGDGFWQLVRYFALDGDAEVGFLAQSPLGAGCAVRFEEIRYASAPPADVRSGE